MINEALIQSIVRNVVQRLQDEASGVVTPVKPESAAPALACRRRWRTSIRVIELVISTPPPLKSGSPSSLIPACLSNSDDPLVCLYEKHQPCDSCGRCEVRGF